jgi:hypothetical protein
MLTHSQEHEALGDQCYRDAGDRERYAAPADP